MGQMIVYTESNANTWEYHCNWLIGAIELCMWSLWADSFGTFVATSVRLLCSIFVHLSENRPTKWDDNTRGDAGIPIHMQHWWEKEMAHYQDEQDLGEDSPFE